MSERDYLDKLRDKLLDIMGAADYTMKEMSQKCNISERKLSEIINREPKGLCFSTLVRISDSLCIPISDLIGCENLQKGGAV